MKVVDMAHADNAMNKASKLIFDIRRIMDENDDERANIALYEYLREAGYFFLGVAAEVRGDD